MIIIKIIIITKFVVNKYNYKMIKTKVHMLMIYHYDSKFGRFLSSKDSWRLEESKSSKDSKILKVLTFKKFS